MGTFKCSKNLNKNKVKIVVRNEAIKLFSVNKSIFKKSKINNFVLSPNFGYVMEARLLAGFTLVHLSMEQNDRNFHIHARIPGLNFFNKNEKVRVLSDTSQIFVFKQ